MTTQARISANQANAQLSTGPKSPEGKERSRMNALKHGLRAETIVLPTEDPAELEAMYVEWIDEWKPPTGTRRQLVRRAVESAWRVNRCVRVETAAISARAETSLTTWDREREEALDFMVAKLADDPREALQRLKWTRQGVERLIGLWMGLVKALAEPGGWYDIRDHHDRYINLRGFRADNDQLDLAESSWALIVSNRPDLTAADPDGAPPAALVEPIREVMSRYARASVEMLKEFWGTVPDHEPMRVREAEREAFLFCAQDLTMQRYEGRLDRQFRTNLTQLMALTKSGIDLVVDAIEEEMTPIEAMPEPVAAKEPKRKSASKAVAPNEPIEIESESTVVQVERDRGGRIWPVEGVDEGPIDNDRV
jgi:hypothetical protein